MSGYLESKSAQPTASQVEEEVAVAMVTQVQQDQILEIWTQVVAEGGIKVECQVARVEEQIITEAQLSESPINAPLILL